MNARYLGLLPTHGRFDYTPITRRTDHAWPNGARLAVYIGFNLEHFAFGEGLGACIGPTAPHPDVLNFSWREYGNRVGAWRCLELFDSLGLAVRHARSTPRCTTIAPSWSRPRSRAGDELIGHGHSNAERQADMDEAGRSARCSRTAAPACWRDSGQAPTGLALALDLGKPSHARPARRGGLRLHAQLVPRRPAGAHAHAQRPLAVVGTVSAGAQRHPDDRRATDGRQGLRRT